MQFVTEKGNRLSLEVIRALDSKGCDVLVLWKDTLAPRESVALFDLDPSHGLLGRLHTHLRLASHRLVEIAPDWAQDAIYLVGVRKFVRGSDEAAESLERLILFSRVDPWQVNVFERTPWGPLPTDKDNLKMYFSWLRDRLGIDPAEPKLVRSLK